MFSNTLSRRSATCVSLCIFVAVLLSRLFLIRLFATDIPWFDQWDSEIWFLLRPFQLGTLSWDVLFSAHMEHRVLFTRIITLAAYLLNDRQYDNIATLSAFEIIYSSFAGYASYILLRTLGNGKFLPFLLLALTGILLPISAENLINSFQSPFFFLIASAITGIWLVSTRPLTLRATFFLLIISIASIFTIASGLLTGLLISCAAVARVWLDRSHYSPFAFQNPVGKSDPIFTRPDTFWKTPILPIRNSQLIFALILFALTLTSSLIAFLAIPKTGADTQSHNIYEMLGALATLLSWPFPYNQRFVFVAPLFILAVWSPWCIGTLRLIRLRMLNGPDFAFTLIGAWVIIQILGMAHSRGHDCIGYVPYRYRDILLPGLYANAYFATRFCLSATLTAKKISALLLAIFMIIYLGAMLYCADDSLDFMRRHHLNQQFQVSNVRNYIATGDKSFLYNPPIYQIPYPQAERLQMILDDKTVRDMLPASVRPPIVLQSGAGFVVNGYPPRMSGDHSPSILGSYDPSLGNRALGNWHSAVIESRFPYLAFDLAGYVGEPGEQLALDYAGETEPQLIESSTLPRETWTQLFVQPKKGQYQIHALDSSEKLWFAFSAPVEVGTLSFLSAFALDKLPYSFAAFTMVLIYLAVTAWLLALRRSRVVSP